MMYSRSRSCSPVREKGPRVSFDQVNALVDYMEINREVAMGGSSTTAGRHRALQKWKTIANSLNAMSGSRKDSRGWSAYWSNYKNKLKSRVRTRASLSEIDRRVLDILGPGFKKKQKPRLCIDPIKDYEVYLVKAEDSEQAYDEWICGGAIVKPFYIVTSAACVEDVQYMYAIAGYVKYVNAENLNTDPCTKEKKKKIVYVCTPKAYEFDYPDVAKWAKLDIAVAKVESKYDFNDQSYLSLCSYIPDQIEINYAKKYQYPGNDALVLGWGHTEKWRQLDDTTDLNNPVLLDSPVRIVEKSVCKNKYGPGKPKMNVLIDKYMICIFGEGNINSAGEVNKRPLADELKANGCEVGGALRGTDLCADEEPLLELRDELIDNGTDKRPRNGICQNDHGGPIITWVGSKEVLIGVASVFRIIKGTNECVGPYLFTSTWCNSAFLSCIVDGIKANKERTTSPPISEPPSESPDNSSRRAICDQLPNEGIYLVERRLSWMNHPDGPAANEILEEQPEVPAADEILRERPQLPLHGLG